MIKNPNVAYAGLVQKYIGTAYDVVKGVYDNLDAIVGATRNEGFFDPSTGYPTPTKLEEPSMWIANVEATNPDDSINYNVGDYLFYTPTLSDNKCELGTYSYFGASKSSGTNFSKYAIAASAAQTVITTPLPFESCVLIIDGVTLQETAGEYTTSGYYNTITLATPLAGTETIEVWINAPIASPVTPYSGAYVTPIGAVADGRSSGGVVTGTDNSDALQEWANKGGNLFLPRGSYRITRQINFPKPCYVMGEGAGSGTQGASGTADEIANSASIILPDPAVFVGDAVFNAESLETNNALPSIGFANFKIEAPQVTGIDAHLLRVINAYDSLEVQNLNLMFQGQNHCGLVLDHVQRTTPQLAQTGIVRNVIAIGANSPTAATMPTIYIRKQQEMQFIGVKAFGSRQADVAISNRDCWDIVDCQGIVLLGCSSAVCSKDNFGLGIYASEKDNDGIVVYGHTFEDCANGAEPLTVGGEFEGTGAAWVIDGVSRAVGGAKTLSKVNIKDTRYQYPCPVAGRLIGAVQADVDAGTAYVELTENASVCTIENLFQAKVIDKTNSAYGEGNMNGNGTNTIISPTGVGYVGRHYSQAITVQRDTPAINLISRDESTGWTFAASISDGGVDYGLQVKNVGGVADGIPFLFTTAGDFIVMEDGCGVGFRTPDSLDDLTYILSIDNTGNLIVTNNALPADINVNNDRPASNDGTFTYLVSSSNIGGTVRRGLPTANNVQLSLDASLPYTLNAWTKIVQVGAGAVTILGETGVTINGVLNGSLVLDGGGYASNAPVYAVATRIGADTWEVIPSTVSAAVVAPQITYDDAATQTFTRQALTTYINRKTAGNQVYTITDSGYLDGDRIEITRARDAAGSLSVISAGETIYTPDGNAAGTQNLTVLGTMVLTKISYGWDATGDIT